MTKQISSSITLHRKPKDGKDGAAAVSLSISADTIIIPTINGDVAPGASSRTVKATMYVGGSPATPVSIVSDKYSSDGFLVDEVSDDTFCIRPVSDATMTDEVLRITVTATYGGQQYTMTKDVAVIGSAQGQTVIGPTGASISKVEEYYLATSEKDAQGNPIVPSSSAVGWAQSHIEPTAALPYVWNKEVIYVTGGQYGTTEVPINTDVHLCCTFSDGQLTHRSLYRATSTDSVPKEAVIYDLDEAMDDFNATNRYFWNREITTYKDSSKNTDILRLVAVWGEKGDKGAKGDKGDKGDTGEDGHPGADAVTYELQPDYTLLHFHAEEDGTFTPERYEVSCALVRTAGTTQTILTPAQLPVDGYRIYYRYATTDGDITWYELSDTDLPSEGPQDEDRGIEFALSNAADSDSVDETNIIRRVFVPVLFDGQQGYNGCVIRKSEWEEGKQYRNDSDFKSADPLTGQFIIDEVTLTDGNEDHTYLVTIAHRGKTSGTTDSAGNLIKPGVPTPSGGWNYDASNNYYRKLNNSDPIRTPFADIDRALVKYLQVQQITLERQSDAPDGSYHKGDIYGAIGGSNDYPIWFGGPNIQQATAKIAADGTAYFNNGIFRGRIEAINVVQNIQRTHCWLDTINNSTPLDIGGFEIANFMADYVGDGYESGIQYLVNKQADSFITAAVYRDRFNNFSRIQSWIVLPCPDATLEGKVIEIFAPASRDITYNRTTAHTYPVAITSLGQGNRWVDMTSAAPEYLNGTITPLWGGKVYGTLLLNSRYLTRANDNAATSYARFVCGKFTQGSTNVYRWVVLASQNARFIDLNDPTVPLDTDPTP